MKKLYLFLICLLLSVFIYMPINASYLADKSETLYDSTNGLIPAKANTICQTEDGYIWIGQYSGLTRYDSKEFKTITKYNDLDISGVTTLSSIKNDLFIGTQNGLFVRKSNGVIEEIKTDNLSISIKDSCTYGNTLFVATDKGLYRYKYGQDENIVNISNQACVCVSAYDESNCFYVLKNNEAVWGTLSPSTPYYSSDEYTIKSVEFHENALYIGTTGGTLLKRVWTDTGYDIKEISSGMKSINDMLYHDDTLYVAADGGLFLVDSNDKVLAANDIKCNKNIQEVIVDYEGNVWLASDMDGVSKITKNKLSDYFLAANLYDVDDSINAIQEYNGKLYIGGDKNIYIFDDKKMEYISDHPLSLALKNRRIRDIEVFKNKLYIATYDADDLDLVVFDDETKNVISINAFNLLPEGGSINSSGQIRCFVKTNDYLFIGTNDGISRYDGEHFLNKKLEYRPLYLYFDELSNRVYLALEDRGLSYTDLNLRDVFDISDELNTSLKCLSANDGLLFTNNNRVYFYKNDEITPIDYEFLGSITELAYMKNQYIIGTDTCVYITQDIFSEKPTFMTLGVNDGLKGNLVANSSGFYNKDRNSYYFTTSKGVFAYNLDSTNMAKKQRKIEIDGIYQDDKLVNGDSIKIDKNTGLLTIQFCVLSYINDNDYTVYYKLDGVDSGYRTLQANETFKIEYTNIRGGKHTFHIYTRDNDGTRSEKIIDLVIVKDKKVYEKPWFWVLIGLVFALVFASANILIVKIRMKKSEQKEKELKAITIESIEAIARTIDAKDTYTNGHSLRVGHFSRIIASELGVTGDELDNLYYIALLHDIGKIGVPDAILNKPGKLTDEEFGIMKSHVTKGAKILEEISTIPHIVEGAKYHHERYGGGGYPEGLKGEEIPYIARIICCADCFDAMATRRVYKDPYTKEKIISEFERCKGIQFDPHMADVVIRLIEEGKLKTEDNIIKSENLPKSE